MTAARHKGDTIVKYPQPTVTPICHQLKGISFARNNHNNYIGESRSYVKEAVIIQYNYGS